MSLFMVVLLFIVMLSLCYWCVLCCLRVAAPGPRAETEYVVVALFYLVCLVLCIFLRGRAAGPGPRAEAEGSQGIPGREGETNVCCSLCITCSFRETPFSAARELRTCAAWGQKGEGSRAGIIQHRAQRQKTSIPTITTNTIVIGLAVSLPSTNTTTTIVIG